jgi:sulfite reductase (NADPH) flavoprotein alpha-component
MIGPGTGVAPFRGFLQEREAQGASGNAWLFFGERNFRSDFLYQTEWQTWLKEGVLTRMDVAFSRDTTGKVYVQDRLRERAADVYAWLQEGAHVYVCGDADHMAPDVHEALIDIISGQGDLTRENAEEYVKNLGRDHRYQRDVY